MRICTAALIAILPTALWAQDHSAAIDAALDTHVLPRVAELAQTSDALATATQANCDPADAALQAAYHDAFDAWIHVSHLRFGPFEADNRAFALAFWPDTRSVTPRTLAQLIIDSDPAAQSVESYADVSVAGRGFYAMEFLLFDANIMTNGTADYRCTLLQTMASDIAFTTAAMRDDWTDTHADLMRGAGANARYQSDTEAMRTLFNALTTGLEFNANVRLGRPLGTFERPRPNRAEARRSGRSTRNLLVSMRGLLELSEALTIDAPDVAVETEFAFQAAIAAIERLEDPSLAHVADPQARFRIEVIQQRIEDLRQLVLTQMGPDLGISAGFNSLDGD